MSAIINKQWIISYCIWTYLYNFIHFIFINALYILLYFNFVSFKNFLNHSKKNCIFFSPRPLDNLPISLAFIRKNIFVFIKIIILSKILDKNSFNFLSNSVILIHLLFYYRFMYFVVSASTNSNLFLFITNFMPTINMFVKIHLISFFLFIFRCLFHKLKIFCIKNKNL